MATAAPGRNRALVGGPGEHRATGAHGHHGTHRQLRGGWAVRSADDPDYDRLGPFGSGLVLEPDDQDGVVTVVAVGGHVGGQSVLVRHDVYLLRPDQDGHL